MTPELTDPVADKDQKSPMWAMFVDLAATRIALLAPTNPRKEQPMPTRKALTLAGLVLTVAALSPASALAAKGGTDRPLKVHQSGTSVFTPTSPSGGTLHSEATGIGSHIGRVRGTSNGTLTFTGPATFTIASSFTNVAANGDEFFGTITGTGTLTGQGVEVDVVSTITGGTGRFEGASGGSTGTISSVTIDPGPPSVSQTESWFKGTISY